MGGNLVIVESPAKAKTIQKYLGKDFTVMSSFGHIRDLQDKKLSVDVAAGFKPEYVVPAEKKKVVAELKKAAGQAELIWLASDEDREGAAISWHLVETLGLDRERTRRIVFHEITKDAILHAIETPRSIDDNLVNAQQARRVLDRLVGFELSPILWRKIQRGLSAGRVQSVALRLVVDREKEIIAFQSSPYYKVEGQFVAGGVKVKGLLDTRFSTPDEACKFLQDSIGATYRVASVEKKDAVRFPAPPFTTSTLQQEAARKLRFPVSLTMRLAQGLYERGLITYMRTDSTNLSALALGTSKQYILDTYGAEYSHPRQYKTRAKGAQEAHEAIRPTFIANTEIEGTAQEKKLYELIWKRTVASQMSEAKVLGTSIKLSSDKRAEQFGIQATEVLFDGFLKLYMEGSDDEVQEDNATILPPVNVGDTLTEKGITAECKFTQAPARYSEATLVKKLEELGIGRPSTYAPTISTLTTGRGYIFKGDVDGRKVPVTNFALKNGAVATATKTETVGAERGKLIPQEIGVVVSDYLVENFPRIMDYDFTADVEKDFDGIAEGKKVWNEVNATFYGEFHKKVETTMSDGQYSHVERVIGVDPADGRTVIARFGQFGAYVQKGEGEERQSASLAKGQLIETLTLEEALKLLEFPRRVGSYEGVDIVVLKGRFGPYIKYGDKNISLPRGADPLRISQEECAKLVQESLSGAAANPTIHEFEAAGISVVNGRYGPYIKFDGRNFRIPRGTDAAALTEEDCRKIIAEAPAPDAAPKTRRFKKRS